MVDVQAFAFAVAALAEDVVALRQELSVFPQYLAQQAVVPSVVEVDCAVSNLGTPCHRTSVRPLLSSALSASLMILSSVTSPDVPLNFDRSLSVLSRSHFTSCLMSLSLSLVCCFIRGRYLVTIDTYNTLHLYKSWVR